MEDVVLRAYYCHLDASTQGVSKLDVHSSATVGCIRCKKQHVRSADITQVDSSITGGAVVCWSFVQPPTHHLESRLEVKCLTNDLHSSLPLKGSS